MYDPLAIANYFLELAERHGDRTVSNLKLQKLIYLAHGWHLAIKDKPLVRGGVEAWRYGPVVPSVYDAFKGFGSQRITGLAQIAVQDGSGAYLVTTPRIPADEEFVPKLLKRIWTVYGGYTALELSNLSHRDGTPWKDLERELGGSIPKHCSLPDEKIRGHFQAQLKSAA